MSLRYPERFRNYRGIYNPSAIPLVREELKPRYLDTLAAAQAEMGQFREAVETVRQAVELARKDMPDMILADIQLADKSSGIDAVSHILSEMGEIPVVFITAFPERLLTGDKPEPAFLISKPYSVDQVVSAVSQAMFFSSTETLNA
mgnify:CR=1 FL=1